MENILHVILRKLSARVLNTISYLCIHFIILFDEIQQIQRTYIQLVHNVKNSLISFSTSSLKLNQNISQKISLI